MPIVRAIRKEWKKSVLEKTPETNVDRDIYEIEKNSKEEHEDSSRNESDILRI